MEDNYQDLMKNVKLFAQDGIPKVAFDTWINPLDIYSIEGNTVTLIAPSSFFVDQVRPYEVYLQNCFKAATKKVYNFEYIAADKLDQSQKNNIQITSNDQIKSNLNSKYTFSTFVIGENNKFAQAAALAVSEAPGTAFNPLFIYGGVGLGKTHLVHAVGNEILQRNPRKKVLYVTSEKFTNEFINTIKDQKNEQFRNKYRNIDVLLIDDIQFIAGKERVQEEFFHTFNTLHESGSQIILSSDRPPKDMPLLESRLKSRFEWGLLVDISIPDFETRVAILRKKAEAKNVLIENEIIYNIATKIDSNIRELEGVFNKIVAHASLTSGPITMEMTEKAINDIISKKEKVVSVDYIQEVVANYFNIDKREFKNSKRSNDVAFPRQIAMYLCRNVASLSFKQIGDDFGKRDHTTVMHAYKKIEQELRDDPNTKLIVDSVKKIILDKN